MANKVEGETPHAASGSSGCSSDEPDDAQEGGGVSAYEQQRLQNIRRNRDKMRALNLLSHNSTAPTTKVPPTQPAKRAKRQQPALPTRRSLRLAQQGPRPNLKEPSAPSLSRTRAGTAAHHGAVHEDAEAQASFWRSQPSGGGLGQEAHDAGIKHDAAEKQRAHVERGRMSSKLLHANTALFMKQYMGQHVPRFGGQVKRAVMEVAAAPNSVKFNRMSGIQEWRNAVFLFVNVDPAGYNNVFLDGGQLMTWFAQPTQKPTTPVIEKLLRFGDRDADASEDKRGGAHTSKSVEDAAQACSSSSAHVSDRHRDEGGDTSTGAGALDTSGCVMLFCRLPGQDYVCLGRLQCEKTDLSARPMRVLWRLKDHPTLQHSSAFREMCCADDDAAS